MKVEIYYQNAKLTTIVNEDLKVKDLYKNLSEYYKLNPSDFILFDNNCHKLKESDIIPIVSNKDIIIIHLIKSSLKEKYEYNNNKPLNEGKNINQLITECTGAKKPLEKNINLPYIKRGITSLFEFFENENNESDNIFLDSPFNIISGDIDIRNRRRRHRERTEANGRLLRELQEMGFPEDRARQALLSSRNNIQRATEMLLGMNN